MIGQNIKRVREKIDAACARAGRKSSEVELVAVTKTVSAPTVKEAVEAGIVSVGENRVQEALEKHALLSSQNPNVRWHLLGHLQSNKVNRAVETFDTIQTLDSYPLALRINQRAAALGKIQDCFVQLKLGDEPTKTGLLASELQVLVDQCQELRNLQIAGLMCIAPNTLNNELARPHFANAKQFFDRIFGKASGKSLSMGMSGDFEVAIEEGSTMVRIGSAIFGQRI